MATLPVLWLFGTSAPATLTGSQRQHKNSIGSLAQFSFKTVVDRRREHAAISKSQWTVAR